MENVFVSIFGETKEDFLEMMENSRDFTSNFELRFDLCGEWKFTEPNLRELFPVEARVIFTNHGDENFTEFNDFDLVDFDILKLPSEKGGGGGSSKSELDFLISAHLFDKFSREKTTETINKLLKIPAKFHKLAVNLDTAEDLWNFYDLSKKLDRKKWILAGIGKFGKISRGIFAKAGFHTFACVKNHKVAPGQIDLETLKNLLS